MKTLSLKSTLLLSAILVFSISFSQPIQYAYILNNDMPDSWSPRKEYEEDIKELRLLLEASESLENTKFRGSAFLYDDVINSFIINNSEGTKAKANLRYNIYNDEFEIQLDPKSDNYKKLSKDPQFEFIMGGEKFILTTTSKLYENDKIFPELGYVVELISGNQLSLYKKYMKNVIPTKKGFSHYHYDQPTRVTTINKYFLKIDSDFTKIEIDKNKVVEAFPRHNLKLENYIDQKGFKFNGNNDKIEKQLLQLVRYYESL